MLGDCVPVSARGRAPESAQSKLQYDQWVRVSACASLPSYILSSSCALGVRWMQEALCNVFHFCKYLMFMQLYGTVLFFSFFFNYIYPAM